MSEIKRVITTRSKTKGTSMNIGNWKRTKIEETGKKNKWAETTKEILGISIVNTWLYGKRY